MPRRTSAFLVKPGMADDCDQRCDGQKAEPQSGVRRVGGNARPLQVNQ
jgi:hypothetical protein